jgi:antitoxin YefM
MVTTFILKANELNDNFTQAVKKSYKNKQIEIIIHALDETEYLMKTQANKETLKKRIKNVINGKNLIQVDLKSLKKVR